MAQPVVVAGSCREAQRKNECRGALLAIVQVQVYENSEVPQVTIPSGAILKPDADLFCDR